jgi:hypothetical protein
MLVRMDVNRTRNQVCVMDERRNEVLTPQRREGLQSSQSRILGGEEGNSRHLLRRPT